jgi:hypothetical protein
MKEIILVMSPKECEQVFSGKQTMTLRKTCPNETGPFRCYIYCTKQKTKINHYILPTTKELLILNKNCTLSNPVHFFDDEPKNDLCTILNGKVIGEFICNRYKTWKAEAPQRLRNFYLNLDDRDLPKLGLTSREDFYEYAINKTVYGWEIEDLKLYSYPISLDEFSCTTTGENLGKTLSRPPLSWQRCSCKLPREQFSYYPHLTITKEKAIDIVEKFKFFQGTIAGRKLWASKRPDVQEKDVIDFGRDCMLLLEYLQSN